MNIFILRLSPHPPLHFMSCFLNNPSTAICAVHILLGVGPPTRVWLTYQEPNPLKTTDSPLLVVICP